jgi:hypothetical protein
MKTDPFMPNEEFISEAVQPMAGTFDARPMGRGEPGLPLGFRWRNTKYHIRSLLRNWKSSEQEGGVGELYLRRHWYTIDTDADVRMTLYCERQARSRRQPKQRWFLFSLSRPDSPDDHCVGA